MNQKRKLISVLVHLESKKVWFLKDLFKSEDLWRINPWITETAGKTSLNLGLYEIGGYVLYCKPYHF